MVQLSVPLGPNEKQREQVRQYLPRVLGGLVSLKLRISSSYSRFEDSTECIRHQCRKTTVLSCQRCLINTGVEIMNKI